MPNGGHLRDIARGKKPTPADEVASDGIRNAADRDARGVWDLAGLENRGWTWWEWQAVCDLAGVQERAE